MHPKTQEREIVVLCSDKDAQPIVNAGTLLA